MSLFVFAQGPTLEQKRKADYHRRRAVEMRKQVTVYTNHAEKYLHCADSVAKLGETENAQRYRDLSDKELNKAIYYLKMAQIEDEKVVEATKQ